MITVEEAVNSLRRLEKKRKIDKCFLTDDGYIFTFGPKQSLDNMLFVKSNGGIRPVIPKHDFSKIIKEKDVSKYPNA